MKLKKRFVVVPILVITVLLLIVSIATSAKPKPKYELSKVEKKAIVETVEASGTINAVKTVSIGSQTSGMIQSIYVDYNSHVKKGQMLAQIDPSVNKAQVEQARAALYSKKGVYQKIKSSLIYDEANYKRYNTLYKDHYVSKGDLELALATYHSDIAQLNAAKADIAQAEATLKNNLLLLNYTKIKSPVDGVVVSRAVDVGQTVAASFQTPTLFTVAQDLTKMQIEVSVSEADIGKVKVGQLADYTLDGYPNETFHGKVTQVRLASTTTSNVVTYTVVVSVDNSKQILKPGMTANVSIIVNKKDNALCVDNAAMRFTPEEITHGRKFKEQGIWLLEDNKPVRVNIRMGVADSDSTEIISNEVQEGDDVIVGSLDKKHSHRSNSMNGPKPPGMF